MTALVRADRASTTNRVPSGRHRDEPLIARIVARIRDEVGWDERHRALSCHPVFAHCGRQEIRWLVRRGEFVRIDAGTLVWGKHQVARWLLVIFTGDLEVGTGRARQRLGPMAQLGADLILAFAPTPVPVRAVTAVDAFALNREHLLGVAHLPSIRAGLRLPLDDATYRDHIRTMRADADAAWRRLGQSVELESAPTRLPASFRLYPRAPGREFTARLLVGADERAVPPQPRLPRRAIAMIAAVLFLAALAAGFTYHPPLAIARPGDAIDVTRDVTVSGAPTYPVRGRYLLLPVVYEDRPLIPLLWAVANGERPVRWAKDDEIAAGRAAYADARTSAVRSVLAATGRDPADVRITFRDRDLVGPSAGLVYALVLADVLDPEDVAGGRTIAATGAVDGTGKVSSVHFLAMKSTTAARADAHVLLIPRGHVPPEVRRWQGDLVMVASVAEARDHLAR